MTKTFLNSLGALATATACARPKTVTDGSCFNLDFNGFCDDSQIVIPGLHEVVTLSDFAFTSTNISGDAATCVEFNYSILNDSTAPVTTSSVANFTFNMSPNSLPGAPALATGVFDTGVFDGFGAIKLCCSGQDRPSGVTKGHTASGTARIYFGGTIKSFDIWDARVEYQSVSCSYGSPCSGPACGIVSSGGNVPESPDWAVPDPVMVLTGTTRSAQA